MSQEYQLKSPWILFLGSSIVFILMTVHITMVENNSGVSVEDTGTNPTGENTQALVEQFLEDSKTLSQSISSLYLNRSQLSVTQKRTLSSHLEATLIDILDLTSALKVVGGQLNYQCGMENSSKDLSTIAVIGEE